ncbi:MAG: glutamate synthase subunit beta [Oscillospiraceae bacterium]|nr:glutamate synthase subunit beta [Oscillospiraceae bacterium]
MGKPTGFMEYKREVSTCIPECERIKNYDEFHIPLDKKEQQIQGARCMECGVPFCQSGMMIGGAISGCPLNNLIPEWNDMVYRGKWDEAAKRLLLTNNFPEFTSRVCPALCEAACTCNLNSSPVSVRENEYAIIENAFSSGLIAPAPPSVRTGKKCAVIGSGPAGLAAAAQLNKRGHSVTVYERSDRPGGLLMYGIPNMKLDKKIVERRIRLMKAEGIEFVTCADIGSPQYPAAKIINDYDAVILACGASQPRDIKAPGRDASGIYFAVDFLKSTTKSLLDSNFEDQQYINAKDKNVIVIGGGDTGNDCVGTVIRHGCSSVTQLEMMPKLPDSRAGNNPWPQWPRVCKTDYGQSEAAFVFGHDPRVYQTTVKEFIKNEDGSLKAVRTVCVEFIKNPETGRSQMQEIEGSEKILDADLVLIAAGFLGPQSYVTESFGVDITERSNVATQKGSFLSSAAKVFAAGDMHIGQSLVVRAISEGRGAAKEADKFLMGYTNLR